MQPPQLILTYSYMGMYGFAMTRVSVRKRSPNRLNRIEFSILKSQGETMIATEQTLENLTLTIDQEIRVQAPLDVTFAALLEQLGPGNETPDGKSLNMKIEPWPGGRWYRDMGNGNGHFWANVKAIMRPTLLEFVGPLFASFPFVSNVQYRLSEVDGGTLIAFRQTALGFVPDEHKAGMNKGWASMHDRVRRHAEASSQTSIS
jgi:hypothetical protein